MPSPRKALGKDCGMNRFKTGTKIGTVQDPISIVFNPYLSMMYLWCRGNTTAMKRFTLIAAMCTTEEEQESLDKI